LNLTKNFADNGENFRVFFIIISRLGVGFINEFWTKGAKKESAKLTLSVITRDITF
jgi:hypothetical protein